MNKFAGKDKSNSYGKVYCAKCVITGKFYVGQTTRRLEVRIESHRQGALFSKRKPHKVSHFYNALRKYGIENFEWTMLCYADNQNDLNNAEKYFIKLLRASDPRYGYNLTIGGESFKNLTDEAKKRARIGLLQAAQKRKGKPSGRKGICQSEEAKMKNRIAHIGLSSGDKNPFYGKTHTQETRQKISESNARRSGVNHHFYGKPHPSRGKMRDSGVLFRCNETGQEFTSILAAAKALKINRKSVGVALAGRKIRAGFTLTNLLEEE